MNSAKILGISRHRLGTDGKGVTTLVGFYGCPLRCKYCLNPNCFDPDAHTQLHTPESLYQKLKCDDLYFVSTGGGVTFGGGEPLLNLDFLEEFKALVGNRWHLTAETSLAVDSEAVNRAMKVFDEFVVDIKDTSPEIYLSYTGKSNAPAMKNLQTLIQKMGSDSVLVRLPLIKDFNTEENRKKSEDILRSMGVTKFDKFTYRKRLAAAGNARLS